MTPTGPAKASASLAGREAKDAHQRVTELQAALNEALADRREAVIQLRKDGRSLQWIGDLLGISKTAVANIDTPWIKP